MMSSPANNDEPSRFALALRRLLDDTGIFTRAQWSEVLGVTPAALSQWVNDRTIPRASCLRSILDVVRKYKGGSDKAVEGFEAISSLAAELVSPHGDRMRPTVASYVVGPVLEGFHRALEALSPDKQEEVLVRAASECHQLQRPSSPTTTAPSVERQPIAPLTEPPRASPIRRQGMTSSLLLIDPHPVFRSALRSCLEQAPEFQVVGESTNAREGFALVDSQSPRAVVMEVSLPGMNGVIATREIKRRAPETQVLILTLQDRINDVLDAFDAGATGYALKSDGVDTVMAAVRSVVRGERYVAPSLASRLAAYESGRRQPLEVLRSLSHREREVFRLAADALLTTREIAQELCVSRKTVDTHLHRIHRKLGLRTSAELVRLAASLGLLHATETTRVGENPKSPSSADRSRTS